MRKPTIVLGALRWLSFGAAEPPTHEDVVRRRVVTLAWPAVVEGLLQTAIGLVDTYLVARVSDAALAGVGTALQLIFIMIVVMSAISVGASVLVAQAIGAQDRAGARSLTRQSLVLAALAAVPLSALGIIFARPLIHAFGVAPDVAAIGIDYWRISAYGVVVMTLMFVASAVLRGAGDTKTSMRATLLANIVNGVLAYLLIFGHLGFPALGPSGSAWAALAGRSVALAVMLSVLLRARTSISIRGWGGWRPQLTTAKRMLGIGAPAAVEELAFSIGFAVLTGVIAVLGTEALAAQRIAFNALSLAFLPGFGLSLAATALVGQSVGARDPDGGRLATHVSAQYAAAWMGGITVLYLAFATPVMRAFSSDPSVVSIGADAMRVVALSQPIWGIMFVYAGALRGTGNSRFPLIVNSVWVWACVGLGALAVTVLDRGLSTIWMIFAVTGPIPALIFRARLNRDAHLGSSVSRLDRLPEPLVEEPAA
jgi:MATE family multidrug resistance protein